MDYITAMSQMLLISPTVEIKQERQKRADMQSHLNWHKNWGLCL